MIRLMTIVTERLDESLLVASYYLNWSIADVVVTVARKALSRHPKHTEWPIQAITIIKDVLIKTKEYEIYKEANLKLDQRIKKLKMQGIDFAGGLRTLNSLKERVTKVGKIKQKMIII